MQMVACISMIDFMPGNGEHEMGIFATFTGKVVRHRDVTFITHYKMVEQILCS